MGNSCLFMRKNSQADTRREEDYQQAAPVQRRAPPKQCRKSSVLGTKSLNPATSTSSTTVSAPLPDEDSTLPPAAQLLPLLFGAILSTGDPKADLHFDTMLRHPSILANIDAVNEEGCTALQMACAVGNPVTVKKLIKAGACVWGAAAEESRAALDRPLPALAFSSPLALAAICGHVPVLQIIAQHLETASFQKPGGCVEVHQRGRAVPCPDGGLVERSVPNTVNHGATQRPWIVFDFINAVKGAVENGRVPALRWLLSSEVFKTIREDARFFALEKDGEIASMLTRCAVQTPYVALAKALFEWLGIWTSSGTRIGAPRDGGVAGPNLVCKHGSDGLTLLHVSVLYQTIPVLRNGREIEDPESPEVVSNDHVVDDGGLPDPRFLDQLDNLAPRRARGDHGHIAKFLLECGADARAVTVENGPDTVQVLPPGLTALHIAFVRRKPVTARTILSTVERLSTESGGNGAAAGRDLICQRWNPGILAGEHGAMSLLSLTFDGLTQATHYAPKGQTKVVNVQEMMQVDLLIQRVKTEMRVEQLALLLIEYCSSSGKQGIDLNERIPRVFGAPTPLFLAAKYGRTTILRALLEAGADPTIPTHSREESARSHQHSAWAQKDRDTETPRYGVYFNATPLHIACLMGHADIVEILLKCAGVGGVSWDTPVLQADRRSDPMLPPRLRRFLDDTTTWGNQLVEESALHLAAGCLRSEVVAALSKHELQLIRSTHQTTPGDMDQSGGTTSQKELRRRKNFGHRGTATAPATSLLVFLIRADLGHPDAKAILKTFLEHGTDFSFFCEEQNPLPPQLAEATNLSTVLGFSCPMLLMLSPATEADALEVLAAWPRDERGGGEQTSTCFKDLLNTPVTFYLCEKRFVAGREGGGEEEILKSSGEKITWSVLSLLKKFRSGQARLEAELLRLGAQEKPGEGQLEKVAPTDDMQVGPACSVLVEEGRKNKTSVRVVAEKATPLGLTINVPFD